MISITLSRFSVSRGKRAEAVDQLGGEGVDVGRALELVHPPVEAHPEVEIGDVGFGQQDRRIDADLRREGLGARLDPARLGLEDRLLEHRLVEFEADLLDMARLLVAEQIAGAADVEIVGGELEAGAETVERRQHLQALVGGLGEQPVRPAW